MSDYQRCTICGNYGWASSHQCPPLWDVHDPDSHGDLDFFSTVRAIDAQSAAEKYAEDTDAAGDYSCVGGSELRLKVRKSGTDDSWTDWAVTGETEPVYHARDYDLS